MSRKFRAIFTPIARVFLLEKRRRLDRELRRRGAVYGLHACQRTLRVCASRAEITENFRQSAALFTQNLREFDAARALLRNQTRHRHRQKLRGRCASLAERAGEIFDAVRGKIANVLHQIRSGAKFLYFRE